MPPTAPASDRDARLIRTTGAGPLWRGMKDAYGFVVTRAGRAEWTHPGARCRGEPGTLALVRPGVIVQEIRRDPHAVLELVLLPGDPSDASGPLPPSLSTSDARARPLLALHEALTGDGDPRRRRELAEEAGAALRGLAHHRPATRDARAVARARRYLLAHLPEAVRLDQVAAHVGLDKYRLIRAFRDETGVPPYAWLIHARISRARRLLKAGWRGAEVATELGFCDQSQLHRHFVRIVGTTPGRYARRI